MGFTLWITLTSICTAVGGYVWLLLQQSFPNDGFRPLQRPGPILLAAADGANLDGLTLIRAVKLPTLKIMLPGIGSVIIQNSTSEMVFKTLRIRDFSIKSEDASIGETKVMGYVDAEFTGLSSVKTEINVHLPLLGLGHRKYTSQQSGRISASLGNLSVRIGFRIGHNARAQPRLKHTSLRFASGLFHSFDFTIMPYPLLVTKLPLWLTLQPVSNFLVSALFDSAEVREAVIAFWSKANPYLDPVAWEAIGQSDRQKAPPTLSLDGSPLFKSHAIIAGQTALVNISLPDHVPSLYPEGGKRAYLQSWNKLTSEVKLEITGNAIQRFAFDKAILQLNSATHLSNLPNNANIMVCRLEGFHVEVTSTFALYANTSKALQFVTGLESLGEKGTSRAQVKAARMELVFSLLVDESGVGLSTLSVDDFDSVNVSIEGLRSKKDDFVNRILKVVRPQIASMASVLIKRFLETEVKRGTKAIESLEEALLVGGVEIPGLFRTRARSVDLMINKDLNGES